MNWSPQQERAIPKAKEWIRSGSDPVFMIAGWAGTGKTTLAKELVSEVKGTVHFAAYTGKAAHVLRKAGCENVSTLHSLIYLPKAKCESKLKKLEAELVQLGVTVPEPTEAIAKVKLAIKHELANLNRPAWTLNTDSPLNEASLVVVDEYSMIDQQLGSDLLSFGCRVLALGDPGQLPPIKGTGFFSRKPDIMLTEIHRQERENPIIWMANEVREGRTLQPGTYGESRVVRFEDTPPEDLQRLVLGTDQLLVGRNATRSSSNRRTRELLGRTNPLPVPGDRVVCLRNNHKIGILNGQIWTVAGSAEGDEALLLDLTNEDGGRLSCLAHPHHFRGESDKLGYWDRLNAEEFDYGYALTCHKAQGSSWPSVLLFDEWNRENRNQWLYTAITRAAEKITIVQM